MKLFHVTDILWDVDNDNDNDPALTASGLNLPLATYVFAENDDRVADLLSARYGWCVDELSVVETDQSMVMMAA